MHASFLRGLKFNTVFIYGGIYTGKQGHFYELFVLKWTCLLIFYYSSFRVKQDFQSTKIYFILIQIHAISNRHAKRLSKYI